MTTQNRRRKQRQAEDLLKPNVCIPIVGFLYGRRHCVGERCCCVFERVLEWRVDAMLIFRFNSTQNQTEHLNFSILSST
ncbi:unnamed protein product, partial [Brenthis ino]